MAVRALRQLLFGAPKLSPPQVLVVELSTGPATVVLKRNAAARRFVLRLARDGAGFSLSMPVRQSVAAAQAFVEQSRGWMERTLARRPRPVPLADGTALVLRGAPVAVRATGKARGAVVFDAEGAVLHVPGAPAHLRRRLVDWLKAEAQRDLTQASQHYAQRMGCHYRRITVRDQKSRWGSCASDGSLSYSWRLILAPPHVLDYVAAHEVAHLREMNHGPRFWRLVLTHCPQAKQARDWLKANGHSLHSYH